MMKRLSPLRVVLFAVLLSCPFCGQLRAWDSTPTNGLYDGAYSRPTHFPDWSQPSTWPTAMFYRCEVRMGAADGPKLSNYEIAVYDQNNNLRHCNRSITSQEDICVLTIRGTEGDKFIFKVIYGDDFASPTIVEAEIPDPNYTDNEVPFATNAQVGLEDPFVLVLPGRTYLLESPESNVPIVGKTGVDVTVKRTINANEWGTICLPFAITAAQMSTAFGEGVEVQLRDFIGCVVEYDDVDENVKSIKVKTEVVSAMEENHPYLIRVSKKVTEISVDDVDIIATDEEPAVYCDEYKHKEKGKWVYDYNCFFGNYQKDCVIEEGCLFLSGGKFWYSTGKTKMMPFRAYFSFYYYLPDMESRLSSARITFDFNETETTPEPQPETPTAISSVHDGAPAERELFDLQGRKLSNSKLSNGQILQGRKLSNSKLSNGQIHKGLYISNGRKFIIK